MDQEKITEYYHLTLIDIRDGVPLHELEEILKLYENEEDYEACAGILKAIQEVRYDTIKNIQEKANGRNRT